MKNNYSITSVIAIVCGVLPGLSTLTACGSASGGVYHTGVHVAGPHLRVGATVTALPRGYHTVRYRRALYYVHDGFFYVAHGRSWRVVHPPVGIIVPHLPPSAQRYRSGSTWLWNCNGVVYQSHGRGFAVVRVR